MILIPVVLIILSHKFSSLLLLLIAVFLIFRGENEKEN